MTMHRIRRYALGLAGLVLIPPLLWIGIVLLAPTAWARRHVVAALEAEQRALGRRLRACRCPCSGASSSPGWRSDRPRTRTTPGSRRRRSGSTSACASSFRARSSRASIEIDGRRASRSAPRRRQPRTGRLHLAAAQSQEFARPRRRADRNESPSSFHGATITVIDEPSKTRLAPAERRRRRRRRRQADRRPERERHAQRRAVSVLGAARPHRAKSRPSKQGCVPRKWCSTTA